MLCSSQVCHPLRQSHAHAYTIRFSTHPQGHLAATQLSLDLAVGARKAIDMDEPSIEATQALLLISLSFIMAGKGSKGYMVLSKWHS